MSYSVNLRTLTWKSSYGFGYEDKKDLTMLQLFDMGEAYNMIRAYYFLEKITYIDEILDALGITEELRIEKPFSFRKGNVEEGRRLFRESYANYKSSLTEHQKLSSSQVSKAYDRRNSKARVRRNDLLNAKCRNKSRNNGR